MNIGKKDVMWGYVSLGMVHGINLILLPVILKFLNVQEVGLWYTFTSLYGLATLIDFGFQTVIGRNISYLWAGADKIQSDSFANINNKFNLNYFIEVISTVKFIYYGMGLIVLIFMSSIGTLYIIEVSRDEISVHIALISYFIYLVSIILNITFSYWNALIKGIGAIKSYNQILILSKAIQLILSIVFLLCNMGLIGISLAYLISVIVNRIMQSKVFYNFSDETLKTYKKVKLKFNREIFLTILPNTMKTGVLSLSNYLIINFPIILTSYYLSLEISGKFGLFNQILTIIITISNSYFNTYISKINYLRVKGNHDELIKIFKKALMTNYLLNFSAFLILVFLGNTFLKLIGTNYELITIIPMVITIIYRFLYNNQCLFTTFLTTKNSIPNYIHFIVSAIATIIVQVLLLEFFEPNLLLLIIPLLIIQLLFNNWFWVYYVIKDMINDKRLGA